MEPTNAHPVYCPRQPHEYVTNLAELVRTAANRLPCVLCSRPTWRYCWSCTLGSRASLAPYDSDAPRCTPFCRRCAQTPEDYQCTLCRLEILPAPPQAQIQPSRAEYEHWHVAYFRVLQLHRALANLRLRGGLQWQPMPTLREAPASLQDQKPSLHAVVAVALPICAATQCFAFMVEPPPQIQMLYPDLYLLAPRYWADAGRGDAAQPPSINMSDICKDSMPESTHR